MTDTDGNDPSEFVLAFLFAYGTDNSVDNVSLSRNHVRTDRTTAAACPNSSRKKDCPRSVRSPGASYDFCLIWSCPCFCLLSPLYSSTTTTLIASRPESVILFRYYGVVCVVLVGYLN